MNTDDSPLVHSRLDDIRNYNIYNGHVDIDEYKYVTEQYGAAYPAKLVNYPIISPKIDLLMGEDLTRPMQKQISAINKSAAVRRLDEKIAIEVKKLINNQLEDLKEKTPGDIKLKIDNVPMPDDVEQYMMYTFKEAIEEVVEDGLDYIINKYNLKDLFKTGFRDLLVTSKEFYKVYIKNGDPFIRRIDPRNMIYDTTSESDFLDDAQWVGEERWLSVNEVLDEYYEVLNKEQVNLIEEMARVNSLKAAEVYNQDFEWLDWNDVTGTRIRVVTCEWKSIKPIRFKVSENKYDPSRPFKKVVPDNYKKKKGDTIETRYIDDIWEGTKVGGQVLVNCRRRPNQVRSVDDYASTPLSYVGVIRNNSTGRPQSLVDLLHNIQMLYNITMYHIELAMARSGGKAVVYDVSQLPTNIGMDIQDIMYHLKNDGIIPINSKDEGNQVATFNQFQQVDFTLSQSVSQLFNLKLMLEETAGQISGITRQRQGAINTSEYVGNVQRSVQQSALTTETWFFMHNEVKKRTLEKAANLMKVAWKSGYKASTILGDGAYKVLNVMPGEIHLNDYGLFLGDTGKEQNNKMLINQIAQAAMQSGQAGLLEVLKVLKADTATEAEHTLERAMNVMKQQQQQQQQMMQAQAQAQEAAKQAEHARNIELEQVRVDGKIAVANIETDAKKQIADIRDDGERDIADMKEKVRMKESGIEETGAPQQPTPSPNQKSLDELLG
jgi:tRNA(Phe) wybutosine-synthesizing methylase Tyw3